MILLIKARSNHDQFPIQLKFCIVGRVTILHRILFPPVNVNIESQNVLDYITKKEKNASTVIIYPVIARQLKVPHTPGSARNEKKK